MTKKQLFLRISLSFTVLALVIFPLFYKLGDAPLRIWDESLFAMRAYHTAEVGGYLPNFDQFPGITFYRNLKPPFGTWFQALSYRQFGYSEWALRFPVAIFLSILMVWLVFRGNHIAGQTWAGLTGALILIGSPGFFRDHVARTGDHDGILLLWMMLSLWFCQMLAQPLSQKKRRLLLFLWVLCLLIGFLTKSFFAWIMVPACLAFLIWKRNLQPLWRDGFSWVMVLLLAASVGLYYWNMERVFPGFLQFESDTVLGRYVKIQDNHQLPWDYYVGAFFTSRFSPWWMLLPLHLFLIIRTKNETFKSAGVLLWMAGLSHLAIITGSTTKLDWYDAPIYPIAALMVGATIGYLMEIPRITVWLKVGIVSLFIIGVGYGYSNSLRLASNAQISNPEEAYQPFMRHLQQERPDLKDYTVYCYEYNGQVGFTARQWNEHRGFTIKAVVFFPPDGFTPGSHVVVCSEEKANRLLQDEECVLELEHGGCQLWKVKTDIQ